MDRFLDWILSSWFGKVILGILGIASAYAAYADFTKLENGEVDQIWGPKLSIGLYKLFGKWPPVVVICLLGLVPLCWGLKHLITGNDSLGKEGRVPPE